MSQVLFGPRLGKEGQIRIGCCAVIFDKTREKVLLTQRTDNGKWCLPGGGMDSGESAAEACEREIFEETSLKVKATRLIAVYSNPDQLVIYNDGTKVFMVVLSFEAEILAGELSLSDETTDVNYFSLIEMQDLPMHGQHKERVIDAFLNQKEAFVR
jgi:ADP-ribose pyrophosphatase YjhB (NUDIX family)